MTKDVVLYDFWAPWCAPCKAMSPTIDAIETRFSGQVAINRINADEDPDFASTWNVRSLPTIVLVVNGTEVKRWVGAKTYTVLETDIAGALFNG